MGHDIECSKPGVDHKSLMIELGCEDLNAPDWCERYEEYREQAYVAQLRRSAGNPLNVVIYKALGVMDDETYSGCSGTGAEHDFSLSQIDTAIELVDTFNMAGAEFPEGHEARRVIDILNDAFGTRVIDCSSQTGNTEPERRFLRKVRDYMVANNLPTIAIQFG